MRVTFYPPHSRCHRSVVMTVCLFIQRALMGGEHVSGSRSYSYFRLLLLLLWSLPRLLSTLRRITVISIMATSLAAGHVTTVRMGWLMYLCIAMLIQVTAHPISSPPTNINLPVTESTARHYYLNVLMQSYLFCQHVCLCWRNKISFSANILFVFCEWMGDLFRF